MHTSWIETIGYDTYVDANSQQRYLIHNNNNNHNKHNNTTHQTQTNKEEKEKQSKGGLNRKMPYL
jgi:hypothetical protein